RPYRENFNNLSNKFHLSKLRFYLASFHILGLMRLQFDSSENKVTLTPYSITVARMVGLFFFYLQCHIIYQQYNKDLDILPVAFMICLLIQPRSVIEKRVRMINQFLKISLYYFHQQKYEIPWTLPIVVVLNLTIILNNLAELRFENEWELYVHPTKFICFFIIYMTTDLLYIGISMLTKYFEILNDEINGITKRLHIAIVQKNKKVVKMLHRRAIFLKDIHDLFTKIIHRIFNDFIVQLIFMVILNINFLYVIEFRHSHRHMDHLIVSVSLRSFIYSLDKLMEKSLEWQCIPWHYMAHQYEFEDILGHYEALERVPYIRKDVDFTNRLRNQSLVHHIIKEKLKILGIISPNRQFLWQVILVLSSLSYFRHM
ncbi:hypothetical protein KR074_006002, partial [Drosophila pseudoananassae]